MIKVQVLPKHIASGKKRTCNSCLIALALKDTLKINSVLVGKITFSAGGKSITLPPEAVDFIHNFDRGIEVKPFDFDIEDILGKQS